LLNGKQPRKKSAPKTVRDRISGKEGTAFQTGKCGKSLQMTNYQPIPKIRAWLLQTRGIEDNPVLHLKKVQGQFHFERDLCIFDKKKYEYR
jgi:hypothetical protein